MNSKPDRVNLQFMPYLRLALAVAVVAIIIALSVVLMRPELAFEDEPLVGSKPQFSLTAADGSKVTQTTYRGIYQLVYFGYSSCPDICPIDLTLLVTAYNSLGDMQQRVQPIFISVDHLRDDSDRMGQYVTALHADLVGLSGTKSDIRRAASSFKVVYRVAGEGENISVDHSAYIYLLDPDGRLMSRLKTNNDSAGLVSQLRKAIQG